MKRYNNIYSQICSLENLHRADVKARKNKGHQSEIRLYDENRQANLVALHELLVGKRYSTSEYQVFKVYETKEREVYKLPYYPDRIVHHAILNILEPIFVAVFTADTYSCIKGKGVHKASAAVKEALKDVDSTTYCLQMDVRKFYPSIDHDILKQLLRRKIKDTDLLWLLDEIIDSAPGVPIGNYLSQYFANFYMAYFDHWLKEVKGIKYYFRYADDLVILHKDNSYLHALRADIQQYLSDELTLKVKSNYQVYPVAARGVDFVGYVHFHTHTRVRKRIKQQCARKIRKSKNPATIASYKGWFKHCNSRHLQKKLFGENI